MKKRFLFFACVLALLVSCVAMSALAADAGTTRNAYCAHCKKDVDWEPWTAGAITDGDHFYLTENKDLGSLISVSGAQVCFDLNGYRIRVYGRVFSLSSKAVCSIMDSRGSGLVNGISSSGKNGAKPSSNVSGGTIYVGGESTLNIYGGAYALEGQTPDDLRTNSGGIIYATSGSTVNIHGGTIGAEPRKNSRAEVPNGGAITLADGAHLNVTGGTIKACPNSGKGTPCVWAAGQDATVQLSGTAQVEEIVFASAAETNLTVSGTYTGKANIRYDTETASIDHNTVIGAAVNSAVFSDENLRCTNGYYVLVDENNKLFLSSYPQNGIVAGSGDTGYATLQEAIDKSPDGYVQLLETVTGDVSISKDTYLQLNGNSISGTVTVDEGVTLYGMDKATADFDVSDGKYGKITAVDGSYAGISADSEFTTDSYIATEENGAVSFHCVRLQIYSMSLRSDEAGLYYKSHFLADDKVAGLIESYGVALSVKETPNASNMDTKCKYTTFTGFESGPSANAGNSTSTMLTGVLKDSNSYFTNMVNLGKQVYGRAYAKTTDGEYIFGKAVSRSLAEQLDGVDQIVPSLSETQVRAVVDLYTRFKSLLANRDLANIVKAVEEEEAGTLKVLILGNSHGLDATNLLYEVFHTTTPEQKVVVGALYYSGCSMAQHRDFLTNNKQVYTYHKNDGSQPNRVWKVKKATCLDALQDEQWDIIVMQQYSRPAGLPEQYNEDWKVVADYLMEHQEVAPKLAFHMTWPAADNYELYLNDDAPLHTFPTSSRKYLEEHFSGADGKYHQSVLYQATVENVQTYLLERTDIVGRAFDFIIPSGTATQYAFDVLGYTHRQIYRDYTHLSDYSRLMVAYLWYAKIMDLDQISIDDVKITEIPKLLAQENMDPENYPNFPGPGAEYNNYGVTDKMREDIVTSVNWALNHPFSVTEE